MKMTKHVAPEGMVFDWAEPVIDRIINLDGSVEERENHLYVKYLFLSAADTIDRYKLVER